MQQIMVHYGLRDAKLINYEFHFAEIRLEYCNKGFHLRRVSLFMDKPYMTAL